MKVYLLLLALLCHVALSQFQIQRSYRRRNGQTVSHLFVSQPKSVYDAEQHCMSHGMHLGGAESLDELRFMWSLIPHHSPNFFAHLGGRLNPRCISYPNFSPDPYSPCSRANIYQWQNGVANGPIPDNMWIAHQGGILNPNDPRGNPCLQFIFGNHLYFQWTGGLLDNTSCDQIQPFFCSKIV